MARSSAGKPSAAIAVYALPGLEAHQLLSLTTSGAYSPTCLLRQVKTRRGDDGASQDIDLSGAVTGPEGFHLERGETSYQAVSHAEAMTDSATTSTGTRGESCMYSRSSVAAYVKVGAEYMGSGAGVEARTEMGIEGRDCVTESSDMSWNVSDTDTSTRGGENRTSSSFSTGLRLSSTPFPSSPVGALLVVLTEPGTNEIFDVRTVQSPHTALVLERPADAYLVVNDVQCSRPETTNVLTVEGQVMAAAGDLSQQVVAAMAEVTAELREQEQTLVNQGVVLSSQLSHLNDAAFLSLQSRLGALPVDALDAPLHNLFSTYVGQELVRLETAVQMHKLEQDMDLALIELAGFDQDIKNAGAGSRLLSLMPRWHLATLDIDQVIPDVTDTARLFQERLFPLLELWHPTTLADLANDSTIRDASDRLLDADFDSIIMDLDDLARETGKEPLADDVKRIADRTQAIVGLRQFTPRWRAKLPGVAISFPRPKTPEQMALAGDPYGRGDDRRPIWRRVDGATSKAVWDALDAALSGECDWPADTTPCRASIRVTPELIYSDGAQPGVLGCTLVTPTVISMGFFVVRERADDNARLNRLPIHLSVRPSITQSFVSEDGLVSYTLSNDYYGNQVDTTVMFGLESEALSTFQSEEVTTQGGGPLGRGRFRDRFQPAARPVRRDGYHHAGLRRICDRSGPGLGGRRAKGESKSRLGTNLSARPLAEASEGCHDGSKKKALRSALPRPDAGGAAVGRG